MTQAEFCVQNEFCTMKMNHALLSQLAILCLLDPLLGFLYWFILIFPSSNATHVIFILFVCVFFTVGVHPVLHGNCGSCFIYSFPAHLSGHLLLLQVMDSMWCSCFAYNIWTIWEFSCSWGYWFGDAHYTVSKYSVWLYYDENSCYSLL